MGVGLVAFAAGVLIKIVDGPLEGCEGKVEEIDPDGTHVRVTVSMFGRETPVDLEFDQIEKL
ncbi:MAG: KOW motif-containing protein [Oscillospiraceae bacterium]|nr:KOW motif-containing protein [Oscillospiraceae bacterium]